MMERYIEYISQLSQNRVNKEFSNCDAAHAIEVLTRIFKSSKEIVRIFIGTLQDPIPDASEYVSALSDFIERGGKVRIILNEYDPIKAKESNLFKRLAYYVSYKNADIAIYQTNAKPYLTKDVEKKPIHFTMGDDCSYRLETDIVKHTATCNFNAPNATKSLISFFDGMEEKATPVRINLEDSAVD